jgi:hypothetical protein
MILLIINSKYVRQEKRRTQLPPAEAGGLITGTRPSKGYSPEGGGFKPPLIDIYEYAVRLHYPEFQIIVRLFRHVTWRHGLV